MKKLMFSIVFVGLAGFGQSQAALAASTNSISLCKCCAESKADTCASPCSGAASGSECPVTVSFDSAPSGPRNQLNGISLKELDLGHPSRHQLEDFRKFLEKERRKAQSAFRRNEKAFYKRRIGKSELDTAKSLFEEVMVNYNHGIYAYQVAAGTRQD